MLVREYAADQNRGLTRQHEPDEQSRLSEGQSAYQRIGRGSGA